MFRCLWVFAGQAGTVSRTSDRTVSYSLYSGLCFLLDVDCGASYNCLEGVKVEHHSGPFLGLPLQLENWKVKERNGEERRGKVWQGGQERVAATCSGSFGGRLTGNFTRRSSR